MLAGLKLFGNYFGNNNLVTDIFLVKRKRVADALFITINIFRENRKSDIVIKVPFHQGKTLEVTYLTNSSEFSCS